MISRPVIIAVDGPAGSGKSSVCALLASELGWTYVNTGAIYRGVGVVASRRHVNLSDETIVADEVGQIVRELVWDAGARRLFHAGEDITDLLNAREASLCASKIASMPSVRARLLDLQRHLALQAPQGAIVDGRDIGTVIFPDADLKIFLTASLEERAKRRCAQMGGTGVLGEVMNDIAVRDDQDSGRGTAPLKKASDALTVDTTGLNISQVVEKIRNLMRERHLVRAAD